MGDAEQVRNLLETALDAVKLIERTEQRLTTAEHLGMPDFEQPSRDVIFSSWKIVRAATGEIQRITGHG